MSKLFKKPELVKSCETKKNKLLTIVVEQHIEIRVQNSFLWLWNMHYSKLVIGLINDIMLNA